MKRQSSSSSGTENAPEKLHAKTIGCMSSIFHLFYKYRNRKKFLTYGKKQEEERERDSSTKIQPKGAGNGLRSPMLPADIRTPPHTVVARLMGVEYETESAAETRRKLVGALERCDEELKAVKRIIEVVKRSVSVEGDNEITGSKSLEDADFNISSAIDIYDDSTTSKFGGPNVQQQQKQQLKKPGREEVINTYLFDRFRRDWIHAGENVVRRKAMMDSVNEVCSDIEWGERREFGRIGLALQDHICRDLIEEMVKEMGYHSIPSLPFEACKRRLCF